MGFRQGIGSARYWYKHGQYVGRDVVALVLCLFLLPFALIDTRFLLAAAALLLVQLCAMVFAEVAYKGKDLWEALTLLPIQLLYICWKLAGILRTWIGLAAGREAGIAHSKRRWRARLRS